MDENYAFRRRFYVIPSKIIIVTIRREKSKRKMIRGRCLINHFYYWW